MGKVSDHSHLLEAWGLGLLLTAVLLGLISLWLASRSGRNILQRVPGLYGLLQSRSLMLLLLASGACLLLLSLYLAPVNQQLSTPPADNNLPGKPALTASTTVPNTVEPVSVPEPAPVVIDTHKPPPPTASATTQVASPPRLPLLTKPVTPLPAGTTRPVTPPKATPVQADAPNGQEMPVKKNVFSTRCARLVEKVGAGEPMTPQEQDEMVSKCR